MSAPDNASCFYTARPNRKGALRRRAGSIITAVIRASTPWTAIPTMRKGSSRSHTIGYRINATRASGQQRTNKRHQSKNAAMGDLPLVVTGASGKSSFALLRGTESGVTHSVKIAPQFARWQALHIAIDGHSRLAFPRIFPNTALIDLPPAPA
jgi:hypothetical protein